MDITKKCETCLSKLGFDCMVVNPLIFRWFILIIATFITMIFIFNTSVSKAIEVTSVLGSLDALFCFWCYDYIKHRSYKFPEQRQRDKHVSVERRHPS